MFNKERCGENKMNSTPNFEGMEMNMNMESSVMPTPICSMDPCMTTMCPPVYECPKERVCHRTINYEVPHE